MSLPSTDRPSRRNWLWAAVGAGALAAGAGTAWWRLRLGDASDTAVEALWRLKPLTPSGAEMPLQAFRGRPLLLNFWATWCPPCVKEMPELDRFAQEVQRDGWQVLGLAIDQAAPVQAFLQQHPVGFPIALAGNDGLALVSALGNPAGGLPFSVLIGANGRIRQRKLGATDLAELRRWRAAES